MKHSRVTVASLAAVLSPLVGIVASLAGALPARGADVPFTEWVISNSADGARSVFAADLNGDTHIDVLLASFRDDKIVWYESDGGSPPTFTEHVITKDPDGAGPLQGFADGAVSVFATDLDGDGQVRVPDLIILLGAWGPNPGHPVDLDGSGEVRVPDLIILLGAWGPCS